MQIQNLSQIFPASLSLSRLRSFFRFNLFLIVLFSGSGALSAQTDCLPEQADCAAVSNLTALVELPKYPGCVLEVSYDLRVCQGVVQIANLGVTFSEDLFSNPECNSLFGPIFSAVFGNDPIIAQSVLASYWSSLETELADQIFQELVGGASEPAIYNCGGTFNLFVVAFYRGSCISTGAVSILDTKIHC
jgi:hypothetical protein